jgi:hypothetical protein
LEKVIKERDKLAHEIIQMRRLQIHISHQLAERYTTNIEGEAEQDEDKNEYRSGRSASHSAKSSKSVKFAKENSSRKMSEHSVKGTAASEARVKAVKEKLKEKADEAAAIAKLRDIRKRSHNSFKMNPSENEANESIDGDSSVRESIVGDSIEEQESGDEEKESDRQSYARSSVTSGHSEAQSFNQSFNSSVAVPAEE